MANTTQGPLGSSGKHSRATRVQKAQYRANQIREREAQRLRSLEQKRRHYQVLESAGRPPSFTRGDMGLSGPAAFGWSSAGKRGWGFDEVWTGRSSGDFRPKRIMEKRIWFQYQEMFQHGGGKYVGQWGTRDVRIQWKGEEDWQNRIKSAYWQSKSYDKQIAEQEAKIASFRPFDPSKIGGRVGRSRGGGAANLQKEAEKAGETAANLYSTGGKVYTPGKGFENTDFVAGTSGPGLGKIIDEFNNPKTEDKPVFTGDWAEYWGETGAKYTDSHGITEGSAEHFYTETIGKKESMIDNLSKQLDKLLLEGGTKVKRDKIYSADETAQIAALSSNISQLKESKKDYQYSLAKLQTKGRRFEVATAANEAATIRKEKKKEIKDYHSTLDLKYMTDDMIDSYFEKHQSNEKLVRAAIRSQYISTMNPTTGVHRSAEGTLELTPNQIFIEAQEKRRELDELERLHQGYAQLQGLDPDRPLTIQKRRKVIRETKKHLPKLEQYVKDKQAQIKQLRAERDEIQKRSQGLTKRINAATDSAVSKYKSRGGTVSSDLVDRALVNDLSQFAADKEIARQKLAVAEAEKGIVEKNIKKTKEILAEFKKADREYQTKALRTGSFGSRQLAPRGSSSRFRPSIKSRRRSSGSQVRRTRGGRNTLGGLVI